MSQRALVTGAGSGVGRAVALAMLKAGWRVAIVGRREEALRETSTLSGREPAEGLICPCDIGDPEAVLSMSHRVLDAFGGLEVLVNAAGTNTPKRSLAELTFGNYQRIVDTNLTGAYHCIQAFLPAMRLQQNGTIINIVSDAGKQASPKGRYSCLHLLFRALHRCSRSGFAGHGMLPYQ